jgi:hypothetical protein
MQRLWADCPCWRARAGTVRAARHQLQAQHGQEIRTMVQTVGTRAQPTPAHVAHARARATARAGGQSGTNRQARTQKVRGVSGYSGEGGGSGRWAGARLPGKHGSGSGSGAGRGPPPTHRRRRRSQLLAPKAAARPPSVQGREDAIDQGMRRSRRASRGVVHACPRDAYSTAASGPGHAPRGAASTDSKIGVPAEFKFHGQQQQQQQ